MNEIKIFNHQVCQYPGGIFGEMNQEADGDYILYSDHEAEIARLRAEVEGLQEVIKKAWEDVNWMTNEGTLLNRECFGYLDAAMGASA